ncbi:LPS export ABC transporter periplasmic protein LptC [Alicycliphilus denitrificans]|uniref:LPS export ABC transporter periplasmic protein LptC n=1 Tax=Alicycliphilus denitrificans TaxID=179636 RepID=UPI003A800856
MMVRLRRAWERLSIYLPVLLMGLLALGTWWLVRNAPQPPQPAQERPVRHEPDYFMRDFAVRNFDATGRLQSEIRGTLARHYADTDTLEIDQARLRSVSVDGRVTTASANRALSNADGSEVQLFGNAIVVREPLERAGQAPLPRLELRSEFLHAWTNEERVRTNQPVTLKRGVDIFTADGLDYDNLDQILNLRGRVRGTLLPATPARPAAKPAR